MGFLVTSGLALLLFFLAYFLQNQRRRKAMVQSEGCALPAFHRPKEPFLAFDFQMAMYNQVSSLYHLHRRYGNTFQVDSLCGNPTLNTIAPENVRAINISKDFGVEPMRLAGMEYFCGRGFITTDGETWSQSRKFIKPSFGLSNLRDLATLSDEVDRLIAGLPKDRSTVDLQPLFYVTFLNSALSFVLGVHPREASQGAPLSSEGFVKSFHDALFYTMFRVILGKAWNVLPQSRYLKACANAHNFLDYYVKQSLVEEHDGSSDDQPAKHGLIRDLCSQTEDSTFIRSQVIQAMMAAQDTTAELLTNALFLLARHPVYWQQLRKECLEKSEEFLQVETLLSSKVIENIIIETLRIYPVFPLLGRIALKGTKLPVGSGPNQDQSLFVEKGTMVVMSYYALHRDSSVFGDDVETFRPDRWNSIKPAQWEFMGFGGGNKACLGQQKAMIEAAYVLFRLGTRFETLESRDDREWRGELKLTCKSANGCKVAFH